MECFEYIKGHARRRHVLQAPVPEQVFRPCAVEPFFHHLTPEDRERTLQEVRRVLRSGGELHVADFGKPQNALMRVAALPWQAFDGRLTTADNLKGRLPEMFRAAGFGEACETARYMTLFGTLSLYSARKVK
ncbi:MAG: class I SAM-dependent methyltransferase [Pyrinomonadaceae bacterium]|nr:class I SAM-dependent methyltransferase [Pyrinomonadaceae bacterium]